MRRAHYPSNFFERPLIVGQGPNRSGDASKPMEGAAGKKLAALMKLTFGEYLTFFSRTNVLDCWYGKNGKGDCFPIHAAQDNAFSLMLQVIRHRPPFVIIVGKTTARAFAMYEDYFQVRKIAGVPIMVIPHPSGVNRWWNYNENRFQAESVLAAAGFDAKECFYSRAKNFVRKKSGQVTSR